MKFIAGLVVGVMLSVGGVALQAQNERAMHPLERAVSNLRIAIDYMKAAPHNFGGHKEDAIHASEEAIRQLNLAAAYRAEHER